METDLKKLLIALDGLPQRKKMCATCPVRPPLGKSVSFPQFKHRCHTTTNALCVQNLVGTPDEKLLNLQLYEESFTDGGLKGSFIR